MARIKPPRGALAKIKSWSTITRYPLHSLDDTRGEVDKQTQQGGCDYRRARLLPFFGHSEIHFLGIEGLHNPRLKVQTFQCMCQEKLAQVKAELIAEWLGKELFPSLPRVYFQRRTCVRAYATWQPEDSDSTQ